MECNGTKSMPHQENPPSLFIDSHCHLFNILDVPLYESIAGLINKDTIILLLASLKVAAAATTGLPRDLLEKNRNFVKFFERDTRANIVWLARQIETAVYNCTSRSILGSDSIKRIIITPLVMDFDSSIQRTDLGSDFKSCEQQFDRLSRAIVETNSSVEIYPFMGLGLNKLEEANALEDFQKWWCDNGYTSQARYQGYDTPLERGKAIGIKLYPPLGFNPCPDELPSAYKEFYIWCVENDIPLAVHCQKSSYCATPEQRDKCNRYTHPGNWLRLVTSHPELERLRINFGHFGGEDQIASLVSYGDNNTATNINKTSWSYVLFQLLRKCPNAYADLAAFDYSKGTYQDSLGQILAGSGDFLPEGDHMSDVLKRKLIWGSDVPMIITTPSFVEGNNASYQKYLEGFILSLKETPGSQTDSRKEICQAVMRTNPAEFLFGKSSG